MKKIVLIDNYDSFTYNLFHQIEKVSDAYITVVRNDEIQLNEIKNFDVIVLSPGPKLPEDAGNMLDVIDAYYREKPIIGICLGMQGIAGFFGSPLTNLPAPVHGQSKKMKIIEPFPLYQECPEELYVGRYHSWGVQRDNMPSPLIVLSIDENNWVMSFLHKEYPVIGIQFHPESILTEYGDTIMRNALRYCGL